MGRILSIKKANATYTGETRRSPFTNAYGLYSSRSELSSDQQVANYRSLEKLHPGTSGPNNGSDAWINASGGTVKRIHPDDASPHGMLFDAIHNRLWFLDWTYSGTPGSLNSEYRFDWTQQKPILMFNGAESLDLDLNR